MIKTNINTVLFDLDGTLLDSAPDLADSLNKTLAKMGREPVAYNAIRDVVSLGGEALVKVCFGITPEHDSYQEIHDAFRKDYEEHICDNTVLFPGIAELLLYIEDKNLKWGVVTDKPEYLTLSILEKIGLLNRTACVVAGDSIPYRKPSPQPLLHACKLINTQPENCIYVGDAQRDIDAAKGANIFSVAALYGYIPNNIKPEKWQANFYIDHPNDLIKWLSI